MAKTQQRFTVDDEDTLVTDWLEAQKNLSMSIQILIHDYSKRFGNTDAFNAVMSRGLDPLAEQQCNHDKAPKTPDAAPVKASPATSAAPSAPKSAAAEPKKARTVLNEDTSKPDAAKESTDSAPPAAFDFGH